MSNGKMAKRVKIEGAIPEPAPSSLADLNLKLLNDQKDCDLLFLIGKEREKIGGHTLILKARFSYFETIFSERFENSRAISLDGKDKCEIVLEEYEPSIFRSFLEHIYAYVFRPKSVVEAVKLLQMADIYGVPSLAEPCRKVLAKPFQLDDLLGIFVAARKLRMTVVMRKAGRTMANYFTQLANSPTFEKSDEATLMYLLERDDLVVKESKLFSILLRWAGKQIESSTVEAKRQRSDILKNLIPLLRFPTMSANEFAQVVAPTKILPAETMCDVFMYLNWDEANKKEVARNFPFSTVPRKSNLLCFDFYEEKSRPGKGTYPTVALQKLSHIQDILTISVLRTVFPPWQGRIVSLVLGRPKYGEPIFQNSAEVAEMNLPITVGISCSAVTTERSNQPTWKSEEVVISVGTSQMILTLDKPWVMSAGKSYEITTRFLTDVYAVPEVLDGERTSRRNETLDFFTGTALRDLCLSENKASPGRCLRLSIRGGTAGTESAPPASTLQGTSLSSGLHLIRSILVTNA